MPKKRSLSQFLLNSRVLIENARNLPEVSTILENFGYTAGRLTEGFQLLTETEMLVRKQIQEHGEAYEATEDLDKACDQLDKAYKKTLKIARIVFGEEANAGAALKLYGPRKLNISGWLGQVEVFYGNLTAVPSLLNRLSKFGYTPQKLTEEMTLLETVRRIQLLHAKESGEAQQSTVARDRKIEELDTWVSELRAVCKIAFSDNPQELEKLGIVVLNEPRAKKPEPEPEPEPAIK